MTGEGPSPGTTAKGPFDWYSDVVKCLIEYWAYFEMKLYRLWLYYVLKRLIVYTALSASVTFVPISVCRRNGEAKRERLEWQFNAILPPSLHSADSGTTCLRDKLQIFSISILRFVFASGRLWIFFEWKVEKRTFGKSEFCRTLHVSIILPSSPLRRKSSWVWRLSRQQLHDTYIHESLFRMRNILKIEMQLL